MRFAPDAPLVRILAGWTIGALAMLAWPGLAEVWALALAAVVLIAVWDLGSLVRTAPLAATRTLPERALVGRDDAIVIVLANPGSRGIVVDVIDELPTSLAAAEPVQRGIRIGPRRTVELRHAIRAAERGDVRLGPVVLFERSPRGLWRRRRLAATADVVRVYPDASRYLRSEVLRPRRVLASLGVRPARDRGAGMEFESLRDYVVGDDVRRIDWAATARRGRPVTRLYQHERNRTVVIALDSSRLMASVVEGRTKLDHAVDAALALAYGAIAAGDRVGMLTFDDTVRGALAPAPHRNLGPFIELLQGVTPRLVEADYVALARWLSAGRHRRALVIVLGDFLDADAATLVEPLAVAAQHHRVLFTAIRDRVFAGLEPGARDDERGLYRRLALDELLTEREATLARLRRAGLETLDLIPEHLTAAVLNRFLAMRRVAA